MSDLRFPLDAYDPLSWPWAPPTARQDAPRSAAPVTFHPVQGKWIVGM